MRWQKDIIWLAPGASHEGPEGRWQSPMSTDPRTGRNHSRINRGFNIYAFLHSALGSSHMICLSSNTYSAATFGSSLLRCRSPVGLRGVFVDPPLVALCFFSSALAMVPVRARAGGRGREGPAAEVRHLRHRGFDDLHIRQHLKALGYKPARICQLLQGRREDAEGEASQVPYVCGDGDVRLKDEGGVSAVESDVEIVEARVSSGPASHHSADGAFIPVPPDGLCMFYSAIAARCVEAWMVGRDEHGWVRDACRERVDKAEATALQQRLIDYMEEQGQCVKAARLRLSGAAGYPGTVELPYFAEMLGGRIEQMDFDQPEIPTVTFGSDSAPILFRIGHQVLRGAGGERAEHWVLVLTYMHAQPLHQSPPPLPRPPVPSPMDGDSIMVLQKKWLDLILAGQKVLEIRNSNKTPGVVFLGHRGLIYGVAVLMPAEEIISISRFRDLAPCHRCDSDELPHQRTWALPLKDVRRISPPIVYHHSRGAIGWVRFAGGAMHGTSQENDVAKPNRRRWRDPSACATGGIDRSSMSAEAAEVEPAVRITRAAESVSHNVDLEDGLFNHATCVEASGAATAEVTAVAAADLDAEAAKPTQHHGKKRKALETPVAGHSSVLTPHDIGPWEKYGMSRAQLESAIDKLTTHSAAEVAHALRDWVASSFFGVRFAC